MTSVSSDIPQMQIADDIQQNNDNIQNVDPIDNNITQNTNIEKSSPQEIIPDDEEDTDKNKDNKSKNNNIFLKTFFGEKKLRYKGKLLRNKISQYYDTQVDDNQEKIDNIDADLLNKSRIIDINNETYAKKQQTTDILISTLVALLFLGIIGGVGNILGINPNTLRIIYLIIIIVYILNVLWIIKYSKPRWDPYIIKGDDGKERKESRKHKKCTSKKIKDKNKCDTYTCQYYGCKPKKQ